jgi:hypothetical protein
MQREDEGQRAFQGQMSSSFQEVTDSHSIKHHCLAVNAVVRVTCHHVQHMLHLISVHDPGSFLGRVAWRERMVLTCWMIT